MFSGLSTVSQGTIGVSAAIFEFTKKGWCVSIPINDNQEYDLVVDFGSGPKTVQVKTTGYKPNGKYEVQLKSVRPNRTTNNIKHFDNNLIDYLFVLCDDGTCYFMPCKSFDVKSSLTLNKKCDQWIVNRSMETAVT